MINSSAIDRRVARRRALLFTLISLLAWETWEVVHPLRHPWGDLRRGNYSDHFSHMNAARLFTRVGFDIWRRSEKSLLPPIKAEEIARLPLDTQHGAVPATEKVWPRDTLFLVEGWPMDKPMISGWTNNPRLYPPGDMVLVAPVAALYSYTSLSFSGACRCLLMLFLFYAHVALFFVLDAFFAAGLGRGALRAIRMVLLAWLYLEIIHWALEGFYDAAALAPLVLCASFLRQRRGLAALAAFCAAAFIHFRALFFVPWAIEAMVIALRGRELNGLRLRGWLGLLLSLGLGAASLFTFWLLWPTMRTLPIGNPIRPGGPEFLWWALALTAVLWAAVAFLLWRAGARRDLVTLGWLVVMCFQLRETYPWHAVLAVLPWAASPVPGESPRKDALVQGARLLFIASSLPLFGFEALAVWNLW
jgi:hypothetical protein